MIVDKLHVAFRADAAAKRQTANPTGSRLGTCAAQLQQLAFPALTKPESWQPRGAAVTEEGLYLEQWVAAKIHKAYPGQWGLRQQAFYFPVPLTPEVLTAAGFTGDAAQAAAAIAARLRPDRYTRGGLFWGWEVPGFGAGRPMLRFNADTGKWRARAIDPKAEYQPSVVLDRSGPVPHVYLAVHIDGMIYDPTHGQVVVEQKSLSNFAFRRAAFGELEYRYRCQLLATVRATGIQNVLWLAHRKETCHFTEVLFLGAADRPRVVLTQPNGMTEVYFVSDAKRGLVTPEAGGAEQAFPADGLWDVAEIWSPYSEADLQGVYARALRVLLAESGQWFREYGPDYRCPRCAGVGELECGNCHGTGLQPRTKKPLPCARCARAPKEGKPDLRAPSGTAGRQRCGGLDKTGQAIGCGGAGVLDEVELPWNCSYCPTAVSHCWTAARVTRTIDRRPHLRIRREDFERSGLTFTPPEAPVLVPEPTDDDEEETADGQ